MLPKDWTVKPIGEICQVQSGGTPSRKVKRYWEGGTIPWVGSAVCKNTIVTKAEEYITKEGFDNSAAKWFETNTVLVALVGATIGKTGLLKFRATTNQNVAGVYPHDFNQLDPLYLFFACQQLYPRFQSLSNDSFKMANLSFVKSLLIKVPPIIVQRRIGLVLERTGVIVKKRQETNLLTNKVAQTVFSKTFGDLATNPKNWNTRTLESTLRERLVHGKSLIREKVKTEASGIPVLKLGALSEDGFDSSHIKYYDDSLSEVKSWILEKDDILISRSNTLNLVGRVGRYLGEPSPCIFSDLMIRVRPNRKIIEPTYLEYYLKSSFVRRFFQSRARGTSGSMPKISNRDILDVEIRVPPMELQRKFGITALGTERLKEAQSRSTGEINQLSKSMMSRAFEGELFSDPINHQPSSTTNNEDI